MQWHLVNFTDAPRIYDHFSDVEVFDNPGIAAIEDYKWKRIAQTIWIIHFLCQQTNTEDGTSGELIVEYSSMTGAFITMIVVGYLLLHLELQQLRLAPARYISSAILEQATEPF
ncbi:hypothetical protein BGZ82_009972 [Podila clonocystis]|nr:hypothetical protein BGZ82_009972 [Podila clonocystis]